MSEPIELEEKIILAGDMATHWGIALASTKCGVFASMHYDNAWPCHKNDSKGRLLRLTIDRILAFVSEHVEGGVDHFVYETPMTQSFHTALVAGKTIGALEQVGDILGATPPSEIIRPGKLKEWAAAKYFAEKHQMVSAANEIAGYLIHDDNEADAVCLAAYYTERVLERQRVAAAKQLASEAEANW